MRNCALENQESRTRLLISGPGQGNFLRTATTIVTYGNARRPRPGGRRCEGNSDRTARSRSNARAAIVQLREVTRIRPCDRDSRDRQGRRSFVG